MDYECLFESPDRTTFLTWLVPFTARMRLIKLYEIQASTIKKFANIS